MRGVAISTTGDAHRLGFLETSVREWKRHMPLVSKAVVTVDGDDEHFQRVVAHIGHLADIVRCGQGRPERGGRQGVAVNKNTGIEYLYDAGVTDFFLSDDDTWPLTPEAWRLHTELGQSHSIVSWGKHRMNTRCADDYASWHWPRGVMMYANIWVIDRVGGMVEEFGPGGHEHVEWSQRIHNAGLTPAPFISPAGYVEDMARAARNWWNCEDMQKRGEPLGNARMRRKRLTSVRREPGDWERIDALMAGRQGSKDYVPFRAHANSRTPAIVSPDLSDDRGVVAAKEPGRA